LVKTLKSKEREESGEAREEALGVGELRERDAEHLARLGFR